MSKSEASTIHDLYWEEGLICREIGKRLGMGKTAILRRMKKYGIPRRRHRNMEGIKNPKWRGGRYVDNDGYVRVWAGNHKYEFEHMQIAEKALGRKLKENERVHHINFKRDDNRNANLLICTRGYHLNLHLKIKKLGMNPDRFSVGRPPL